MTKTGSGSAGGRWVLVETLCPDKPGSVICTDGKPREWSSLGRVGRSRQVSVALEQAVAAARSGRRAVRRTIGPERGVSTDIAALPLAGPTGDVHAVCLWLGSGAPPPLPTDEIAFTFEWDSESHLLSLGALGREVFRLAPARAALTAPEVFRAVGHIDDAMALISKALDPRPEDRWDGLATMKVRGRWRAVHVAMRVLPEPRQAVWRGIVHDVSNTVSVGQPSIEQVTLSALAARHSHTAMALMDVDRTVILHWVTEPLADIQWKGMVDDQDTPHEQDIDRLYAAARALIDGTGHVTVDDVRLRRSDGRWQVVDTAGTLLPDTGGRRLALLEFTPRGVES